MAFKKRRAASPSSSVSGGDFEDSQPSLLVSSVGRKRRRISSIPTVDPVKWLPDFQLKCGVEPSDTCIGNVVVMDGHPFDAVNACLADCRVSRTVQHNSRLQG